MSPDEIRGEWVGRFTGTNAGRLNLRLTPVPLGFVAEANLDDDASGPAYLIGNGELVEERFVAKLVTRDPTASSSFGTIEVAIEPQDGPDLRGSWKTAVGTHGEFTLARPKPTLSSTLVESPTIARFSLFERHERLRPCAVDIDVLRRVQAILGTAAEEAAAIHERKQYSAVKGGPAEIRRLYRVTIVTRGAQGELNATDDPTPITPDGLPHPLTLVEFEIGFNYRAATSSQAPNRATVKLDFRRPAALDFAPVSGAPTPNESHISSSGLDTLWVAGVFERVSGVIRQNRVRSLWLHRSHTYDILLLLLGGPLAAALGILAGSRFPVLPSVDQSLLRTTIALFAGVLTLVVFRLLFSLTRWLLPYVEFATSPVPLHRRLRLAIAGAIVAVLTGILASAVYSLLVSPA